MTMQEIRAIARERSIKPGKRRKVELIRALQRAEGNFDCFGRNGGNYCDQAACLWREDCLSRA